MKKICLAIVALLFTVSLFAEADPRTVYAIPIVTYLNKKAYTGDQVKYQKSDLEVPPFVQACLDRIGLSRFSLLRNEIWARHGYVFKTEVLAYLFGQVKWYKPDPQFGMGKLGGLPAKNADWVKTLEDNWDYDNIAAWLSGRPYKGDIDRYMVESYYQIPDSVRLSANHLGLRTGKLLRNEIFARQGLKFQTPVLQKVFSRCLWYEPTSDDVAAVGAKLGQTERVNVVLCKQREVLDNLESVNYTLPPEFTWVPTIDYGALFIRSCVGPDQRQYFYSSTDLWTAMAFKPETISGDQTKPDDLVPPEIVEAIKAERDPLRQLTLYFSNKRYKGFTDTQVLNATNTETPSYLAKAVIALRLDWYAVLRKEIHARHGAFFADPKIGPIFKACPWYKAKYYLTADTATRFPAGVSFSSAELTNFALLEGQSLSRLRASGDSSPPTIVVDLTGTVYRAKIEEVNFPTEGYSLRAAILHPEGEGTDSVKDTLKQLMQGEGFDYDAYFREEAENGFGGGC